MLRSVVYLFILCFVLCFVLRYWHDLDAASNGVEVELKLGYAELELPQLKGTTVTFRTARVDNTQVK